MARNSFAEEVRLHKEKSTEDLFPFTLVGTGFIRWDLDRRGLSLAILPTDLAA